MIEIAHNFTVIVLYIIYCCLNGINQTNDYIFVMLLKNRFYSKKLRGEWPSGLNILRQVTEVKLGRVRSDSG